MGLCYHKANPMKQLKPSSYLFIAAIVGVLVIAGVAVHTKVTPSPLDGFAQCISDKGATMYGAWWCSHCQAQKTRFGSAFDKVTYVECSPNGSKVMSQECRDLGVKGFPEWRFADGSIASGEQELADLAAKTGCQIGPQE